ncbi:PREDICTED: protein PRRC1-like isoform X3 [Polistes dominula]|uniref:Protein PRRC1-like isoform X3 n=1 Tax=Polistes dominula TaxID=743375 RepID=A0ABM1IJL7_POLDO|nr:PREDICTED: protein PRRC1-like isoform X3 [Polistes dominula]
MTDESNGESTFEFVEKKSDDISVPGEIVKTDSFCSLSSSTSLLTPLGVSTSTGNLFSNLAPPAALPSFVSHPVAVSLDKNLQNTNVSLPKQNELIKKPLVSHTSTESKQEYPITSASEVSTNPPTEPIETQLQDSGIVGSGLLSWVKETAVISNVLSKVAEKAKNSVNTMITTLDPQMREFIYSGGDIEIVVASDKDAKISPVRQAFQAVFGKATVTGIPVDCTSIAAQPVGFAAGVKEIGEDKWYDLGVILLNDPKNNVNLQTFTQMTPVPSQIVLLAQQDTPEDYPLKWSGLSVTIGSLMANNLQVSHNEWHHALTGVSRRDLIFLAVQSLAGIYKTTINPV